MTSKHNTRKDTLFHMHLYGSIFDCLRLAIALKPTDLVLTKGDFRGMICVARSRECMKCERNADPFNLNLIFRTIEELFTHMRQSPAFRKSHGLALVGFDGAWNCEPKTGRIHATLRADFSDYLIGVVRERMAHTDTEK